MEEEALAQDLADEAESADSDQGSAVETSSDELHDVDSSLWLEQIVEFDDLGDDGGVCVGFFDGFRRDKTGQVDLFVDVGLVLAVVALRVDLEDVHRKILDVFHFQEELDLVSHLELVFVPRDELQFLRFPKVVQFFLCENLRDVVYVLSVEDFGGVEYLGELGGAEVLLELSLVGHGLEEVEEVLFYNFALVHPVSYFDVVDGVPVGIVARLGVAERDLVVLFENAEDVVRVLEVLYEQLFVVCVVFEVQLENFSQDLGTEGVHRLVLRDDVLRPGQDPHQQVSVFLVLEVFCQRDDVELGLEGLLEPSGEVVLVYGGGRHVGFECFELLEGHFEVVVDGDLEPFGGFDLICVVGLHQFGDILDVGEVCESVQHVLQGVDALVQQSLHVQQVVVVRPDGLDLVPGGLVVVLRDCRLEPQVCLVEGGRVDWLGL